MTVSRRVQRRISLYPVVKRASYEARICETAQSDNFRSGSVNVNVTEFCPNVGFDNKNVLYCHKFRICVLGEYNKKYTICVFRRKIGSSLWAASDRSTDSSLAVKTYLLMFCLGHT